MHISTREKLLNENQDQENGNSVRKVGFINTYSLK